MTKFRLTVADPTTYADGIFEGYFDSMTHCIRAALARGWRIRQYGAAQQNADGSWKTLDHDMELFVLLAMGETAA